MRLSTKGRYAVMAMADLARREGDATRAVALADIAERQEISLSYLEQLFSRLRRKGLVKQVKEITEEAKVAVREARREVNEMLKEAEKKRALSEDELKKALEKVQEIHDRYIKQVTEITTKKEAEIMEV